jgi:hypothetical protein
MKKGYKEREKEIERDVSHLREDGQVHMRADDEGDRAGCPRSGNGGAALGVILLL